jgi:AcrR family transcriptional regulator
MTKSVKRPYSSPKRREQADETRDTILRAARTLFIANGYTATTIQSVAQEAGVAVQTVYAVFKNKRQLLDQVIEAAVAGADGAGPSSLANPQVRLIAEESDPRRRAEMDAAFSRAITERVAPIIRVAREAASSDREFAEIFNAMKARRRAEMAKAARVLEGPGGHLRMSRQQAAATLYVLYSPDVADLLLQDYGWSPAKYEKWLADMLYSCLLAEGPE